MPLPTPRLRVLANPWTYIDHFGRPAGKFPRDAERYAPGGFVGSEIADVKLVEAAKTETIKGRELEYQYASHDVRMAYSKEPELVENIDYYRNAVRDGSLVAADDKTAALCGLKFEEPKAALERLRKDAIERFNAETGDDAHGVFGGVEPLFLPTASELEAEAKRAQSDLEKASNKSSLPVVAKSSDDNSTSAKATSAKGNF